MEILGIGTDIIEIERIAKVFETQPRFKTRIYTKSELDYCLGKKSCFSHLAARFAAKEAVAKAVGQSLSWQDVEISNGERGKPAVKLHGKAERLTQGRKIMLTMSHSESYATATAILITE